MDFSKKYDISVYLTEEQLNKRIAEIGAQITEAKEAFSGKKRSSVLDIRQALWGSRRACSI